MTKEDKTEKPTLLSTIVSQSENLRGEPPRLPAVFNVSAAAWLDIAKLERDRRARVRRYFADNY